jgi:tetratricopeptide (TPR) repeat protein
LKDIRKDYDRAEEYFKKALELDPIDADNTGNYANFLKDIRKDYDRAEEYYKKALELDPNHANNTGNYAQLLIVTGRKQEGYRLINKAFQLKSDNESLLVELWFYRYANLYEEYGENAYEEIMKLITRGARSIGWNLKDNIELAKKEGHPHIDRLEKLNMIITEDAPLSTLDE